MAWRKVVVVSDINWQHLDDHKVVSTSFLKFHHAVKVVFIDKPPTTLCVTVDDGHGKDSNQNPSYI